MNINYYYGYTVNYGIKMCAVKGKFTKDFVLYGKYRKKIMVS